MRISDWSSDVCSSDLGAFGGCVGIEQLRAAHDDAGQIAGVVELEPGDDAETVAQGVGQHAGARGGANKGKGLKVDFDAARRRPFTDENVDLIVFQEIGRASFRERVCQYV